MTVVVDPAVTTTTAVILPVDAAGVEYDAKEDGTRNGAQSSKDKRLHSKGQRSLLLSYSSESQHQGRDPEHEDEEHNYTNEEQPEAQRVAFLGTPS